VSLSFVTGSRDRTLKTWQIIDDKEHDGFMCVEIASARREFSHSVMATSISRSSGLLAVGLEDGTIGIYRWNAVDRSWNEFTALLPGNAGGAPSMITAIEWHPTKPLLAVCSSVLQLYRIAKGS
jgi:WD40 repeat protein